jgi:hypothetical protein
MNASLWDRPAEMSVIVTVIIIIIIIIIVEGTGYKGVASGVYRLCFQ